MFFKFNKKINERIATITLCILNIFQLLFKGSLKNGKSLTFDLTWDGEETSNL